MKGWGTDEDALIDVLTHQSYNRRLVNVNLILTILHYTYLILFISTLY